MRLPGTILALATAMVAAVGCGAAGRESPPDAAWTDPSPHAPGFIHANGARLHYLDWGGTGPTLILIHGFGDNPHVFDGLAPALTDRFRVVAYARRGHGRSEAKPPYDTATLTEDLRQLMDSLGLARAHLAGWSMGGNEITAMAGAHPDRVDRIVYLDAAFDWSDPASAAAFQAMPVDVEPPPAALASLAAFRAHHRATWYPAVTDTAVLEAALRDRVDVLPDGTVRMVMTDSVTQQLFGTLFSDRRDYRRVRAPALAVYAETFFDVRGGDSAQAARNLEWERQHFGPFRDASIARIHRELGSVEVLALPGTHGDFVFTSRDALAAAMRRFLLGEGS